MGSGSRERRFTILLLLLLLAIVVVIQYRNATQESEIPLDSRSAEPNGTAALRSWIEAMGYTLAPDPLVSYEIEDSTGLIFILEPLESISNGEWGTLEAWVEAGGILVVAANGGEGTTFFSNRLGLEPRFSGLSGDQSLRLANGSPFLSFPEIDGPFEALNFVNFGLETEKNDVVVHLTRGETPVLVSRQIGRGVVIATTETGLFTNEGLTGEGNRTVVLNLILLNSRENQIWIDEWHHGLQPTRLTPDEADLVGPLDWLRFTAPGRAVLFTFAALFLFVLLSGRRLGRPDPPPETLIRRGPAEYVEAVSRLVRESGDTNAVSQHFYTRLRRSLIKTYRLSADLTDERLVQAAAERDQRLDAKKTLTRLNRLKEKNLSEQALVEILGDSDRG